MHNVRVGLVLMFTALLYPLGCGDDDDGTVENTGSACSSPDQCYPTIDQTELSGEVICLSVQGGYCTHRCTSTADCCAAQGECRSGFPQICGPFENTMDRFCFLRCDADVVRAAGYQDSGSFCRQEANPGFTCRSTGGGAEQVQVCAP